MRERSARNERILLIEDEEPIRDLVATALRFTGFTVETAATFPNGTSGSGLDGLRAFMRARGQTEFVDTLCRELLVYGLGRSLLRSDEPLVAEMRKNLSSNDYKFSRLVEDIVTSRQFLMKRVMQQRS